MAAAPGARLIRWLRRLAGSLALLAGLYMLAAWIGSSIPRNRDWREPDRGYTIGIETNGVHTALVMPITTRVKDWREEFPLSDLAQPGRPYTHVSVSWGEREVFLDTSRWRDLSPLTVLRILVRGGEGLAHVSYYVSPAASADLRPLRLTRAQYARLVTAVTAQLPARRPLVRHPGYGTSDVFYESGGRYTPVHTCNQWTSDRLAAAGVRTGWWTPIASGAMKWVAPPHDERAFVATTSAPASSTSSPP